MEQKIETTGTSISLFDLWMMVKRNLFSIIYFAVLGLVLGIVYTTIIITPEYTATASIVLVNPSTAEKDYVVLSSKREVVIDDAITLLSDDGITTLGNGAPISAAFIKSGLSVTSSTTSPWITVTFKASEKDLVVPVTNAIVGAATTFIKADNVTTGNKIGTNELALSEVYSGPSKKLYLAIFVVLGAVVGAGLGIVTDIIEDRIYYPEILANNGINAFKISHDRKPVINKTKKSKKEIVIHETEDLDIVDVSNTGSPYYLNVLKLQNDIENFTPDKQVKTIGLTTASEYQSKLSLLASLSYVYANESQKVLVLDFDFENPNVHTIFKLDNSQNIVSYYQSYKPKEEFIIKVNSTLFVLPGLQSAIGSKIIKSDRIAKLIEEAKKEYDYVLINLPPVLKDTAIFSCINLLDGVLLVGRIGNSKRKDFIKTSALIANNEFHLIGGALLKAEDKKKGFPFNLFSK